MKHKNELRINDGINEMILAVFKQLKHSLKKIIKATTGFETNKNWLKYARTISFISTLTLIYIYFPYLVHFTMKKLPDN